MFPKGREMPLGRSVVLHPGQPPAQPVPLEASLLGPAPTRPNSTKGNLLQSTRAVSRAVSPSALQQKRCDYAS